jgi:uncharacterized protein YigE (DUF2233 family)
MGKKFNILKFHSPLFFIFIFKLTLSLLFLMSFPNNLYAEYSEDVKYIKSPSGSILKVIENNEWKNIDDGVYFKGVKLKRGEKDISIFLKFLKIDLQKANVKIIYNRELEKPLKNIKYFAENGKVIALINGSFFDIYGKPLGLLIVDGETINSKIVTNPLYSGIFYVKDNIPHIVKRDNFHVNGVTQAIQVGPILIADGKEVEGLRDIHSIHYRSGIAIDDSNDSNKVIIYATDTNYHGISLSELRQVIKLLDIGCLNVLNLDGGGSTQMFVSTPLFSDYIAGRTDIPVAIGFYRR